MDNGNSINLIIKQIGQENMVHGESVGFGGEKTEQYIRFEELLLIASNEDLLKLSSNANAVVRCYAIWGLSKKGYSELFNVIKDHLEDVEVVETFFGCRLGATPVGEFCLNYCNLTKSEKLILNETLISNQDIQIKSKENLNKMREELKEKYLKNNS